MNGGMYMRDYPKPDMQNLQGETGRRIFNIIMNSPKPDLTELERKVAEHDKKVMAERMREYGK